jgi:hypothetical protein
MNYEPSYLGLLRGGRLGTMCGSKMNLGNRAITLYLRRTTLKLYLDATINAF